MNSRAREVTSPGALVVMMPLFNDWSAAERLLEHLDTELVVAGLRARVLVVDDGSQTDGGDDFAQRSYCALDRVDVLVLRRNLGHQRAIAIGLAYIEELVACDAVVVMDSDGEDSPADVPRLVERFRHEGPRTIVFAERTRRSERLTFRMFYVIYRVVHYLLTGYRVRVGNFSVIPRANLASLVVVSDMWNHYAAAAFRSRQVYCTVPTVRATRLDGKTSMNFVSLVTHGLSAISVYRDVIGVRLLMLSLVAIVLALVGLLGTIGLRVTTDLPIPGWTTNTAGIFLILLSLSTLFALVFTFVILGGRSGAAFLPRRDYSFFVDRVRPVVVLGSAVRTS